MFTWRIKGSDGYTQGSTQHAADRDKEIFYTSEKGSLETRKIERNLHSLAGCQKKVEGIKDNKEKNLQAGRIFSNRLHVISTSHFSLATKDTRKQETRYL